MNGKISNIAAGALAAGAMLVGSPNIDATEPKANIEQKADVNISPETDFVSKVLYSETSSIATNEEVKLIASVIYNRTKNKAAFGRLNSAYDVVSKPGQFTSVNDSRNSNWKQYNANLNKYTKNTYKIAEQLMSGTFIPTDSTIVLYHDNSISEPPRGMYSRKYWKAVLVKQTKNYKFYKLIPKK